MWIQNASIKIACKTYVVSYAYLRASHQLIRQQTIDADGTTRRHLECSSKTSFIRKLPHVGNTEYESNVQPNMVQHMILRNLYVTTMIEA